MSIFSDIIKSINRHREHKEEKVAEISMNDGNHGQIFGINRKIVISIFILFITVFIIAFIFASDNNDKKNKATNPAQTKTEVSTKGNDNDLPSGYESLNMANNKAAGKPNTNNTVQATRQISNNSATTGNTANSNSSVPAIRSGSYSQPYTLPFMGNYQQPQVQTTTVAAPAAQSESASSDSLKNKFSAAIAFALGNSDTVKDNTVSAATPSTEDNSAVTYTAPSANSLQIGTLIPVMLITGINTDTPGQVQVRVESDIYDSLTDSTILIPAGSQIFGSYDSSKPSANGRISVAFNTLVTPDGSSWNLGDSMIAVDGAGYTGITGNVNNHTGRAIGSGMLASTIAALGSIASGNTSSTSNTYSAGQLAGQGAMASLVSSASDLFKKGADVTSTVTVDPGYEFNIYVSKAINF
ncbi:TrbI/VirB10 family protein [Pectinatus frisingensis]|uniref:TrbI/VirB10 family protein n=1 Tax=Pectinatus frisingensis TaxID=865 RepID=UPI003D8041F7